MSSSLRNVCVYCGSSPGRLDAYAEAAYGLGQEIARRGLGLVYGGGRVGLMGAVAQGALDRGGRVTGIIPAALMARELGNTAITELVIVRDMHERKAQMAQRSDAFIALPGGWGTMEELTEMLTWLQLGLHQKPIALLDVADYFAHLLAFTEHMIGEGFVRPEHAHLFVRDTDAAGVLDRLAAAPATTGHTTHAEPSPHQRQLGVK